MWYCSGLINDLQRFQIAIPTTNAKIRCGSCLSSTDRIESVENGLLGFYDFINISLASSSFFGVNIIL